MNVVGVKFNGVGKTYYFDSNDYILKPGVFVIV